MKNIFKKFKNNFSQKFNLDNQNYSQLNNSKKANEKSNEKSNNKLKILKIDGNQFDINLLDKKLKNIIELYEISNMKIQFFEI